MRLSLMFLMLLTLISAETPAQPAISSMPPVPEQQEQLTSMTLTGKVTEVVTDTPIPGARVFVGSEDETRDNPMSGGITDEQGYYVLEASVPADLHSISVSMECARFLQASPAAGAARVNLSRVEGLLQAEQDFKAAMAATISGTVLDDAGRALAEAKVTFDRYTTTTNELGQFRLTIPTGVRAPLQAAFSQTGEDEVGGPEMTTHTAGLVLNEKGMQDVRLVIIRPPLITGKVLDPTGNAVDGAIVSSSVRGEMTCETESKTNSDGSFSCAWPAGNNNGPVVVSARLLDRFGPSDPALIERSQIGTSITLKLQAGVELRGVVVDKEGKPVSSASLSLATQRPHEPHAPEPLHMERQETETAADGSFVFPRLPQGKFRIDVSAPGIGPVWKEDVSPGPEQVRITMDRDAGTRFKGTVVDYQTSAPVSDYVATTGYEGHNEERVEKDKSGTFTVTGLNANVGFRITVSKPGFTKIVRTYERNNLKDLKNVEDTFVLGPGGTVRGRLVDNAKKPLPAIPIVIVRKEPGFASQNVGRTETDTEGRFEARNLMPGSWQVCIGDQSVEEFSHDKLAPVQLDHGKVVDIGQIVVTEKSKYSRLFGELLRAPGYKPVANCRIFYGDGENEHAQEVLTDRDGRFDVKIRGTYTRASIPQYGLWGDLGCETSGCLILLGSGRIHGVVKRGGKPVSNGHVSLGYHDANLEIHKQELGPPPWRNSETLQYEKKLGPDGGYEFPCVFAGTSEIEVYTPNEKGDMYNRTKKKVEVPVSGDVQADFDLEGGISGKVVDGQGSPVSDVIVSLQDGRGDLDLEHSNLTARTDGNGCFSFQVLPDSAGKYTLGALKKGFGMTVVKGVEFSSDKKATPIQIKLDPSVAGTIEFAVPSDKGSSPSPQLILHGDGWSYNSSEAGADGTIAIKGVPPGKYQLDIFAGSWGITRDVEVFAGQTARVAGAEHKGGTFIWTLAEKSPERLRLCYVFVKQVGVPDDGKQHMYPLSAAGVCRIDDLPPGSWHAELKEMNTVYAEADVVVRPGATTEKTTNVDTQAYQDKLNAAKPAYMEALRNQGRPDFEAIMLEREARWQEYKKKNPNGDMASFARETSGQLRQQLDRAHARPQPPKPLVTPTPFR